ncbi:MAG: hypothetical protein U0441_19680 [Polyangiaceae bacterium]
MSLKRSRSRSLRGAVSIGAIALAAAAVVPGGARAQTLPTLPPGVSVNITPTLSTNPPNLPTGWTPVLITIGNAGGSPLRGEVEASLHTYGDKRSFESRAPYAVAAGATVSVELPVDVPSYGQVYVRVIDKDNGEIASTSFTSADSASIALFDTSGSQLKGAINDTEVTTAFEEGSHLSRTKGGAGVTVNVVLPRVDAATGDPILPDRSALYASVSAVLMRSETLVRLTEPDLSALTSYVLSGGTLAITITRPEDVRNPTIAALVGGPIAQTAVSSEALRPLVVASSLGPVGLAPGEDLGKALGGFRGGNLKGSAYGNSAPYGLGEVHLLAFDPTRKPALDDAWARVRMVDLTRRAFDRRANIVFRPGAYEEQYNLQSVRRVLDPNESSRWAIGAAALLLLVYAVLAAPLNYSLAAKRNKPLRALRLLPLFSAITFFVIVGIGMLAKGVNGRARHLSLVDAGAGMPKASIRRYRAFFASRAKELTVRTTDASGLVRTAIVAEPGEANDRLVVDREGVRLVSVDALPWQTLVVREDGVASLGEGIAIAKKQDGTIAVKNRTGRDLRAALLHLPGGDFRYFPKIEDGQAVDASAGRSVGSEPRDRMWLSAIGSTHTAGTVTIAPLQAYALGAITDDDVPGLGQAWGALEEAGGHDASWFPDDVPVLIAQIQGGEGRSSDSSLRLESDRMLVRVVGFGGAL